MGICLLIFGPIVLYPYSGSPPPIKHLNGSTLVIKGIDTKTAYIIWIIVKISCKILFSKDFLQNPLNELAQESTGDWLASIYSGDIGGNRISFLPFCFLLRCDYTNGERQYIKVAARLTSSPGVITRQQYKKSSWLPVLFWSWRDFLWVQPWPTPFSVKSSVRSRRLKLFTFFQFEQLLKWLKT